MKINYKKLKETNICKEAYIMFLEKFGRDDVELDDVYNQCPNGQCRRWIMNKFSYMPNVLKRRV